MNPLRKQRPKLHTIRPLTLEQRKALAVRGAQYSPTLEQWIGFLFDGKAVTLFEARTNRARAIQDAHDHYDRIFHPETPKRRWLPSSRAQT